MSERLIVWSILIALMVIAILPGFATAQVVSGSVNTPSGYSIDNTTGNLIPYDSSLTTNNGWTSTTGAAGNWTPYGSPQGSFSATDGYTFSYLGEELGIAGINLGSFAHGYQNVNAVFVTGFMYGLKYRFPCANQISGSCSDINGPQDTLRVEVGYYPSSGAATFYVHQLGLKNITDGNSAYNPAWQQLAETVTFSGAKTLAQAGTVNMGIYGQDAGYWACIMPDCYGPQVKDAYIRANYSVDPCILNPAYSPSCPGFNNVIQGAQSPVYWHSYNIAQRLPHIGGGVQLHGFDYGFNWSNFGSCYNTFLFWCTDWRTDGGGTVNFRVTDSANNILYSDSRYREGNNASGSYSNRFLFTETRNSLDMGNVSWWVSGGWNNFAVAGWTRPIWTPDPCYEQPLYSPNCSNFDAEIKRLAAEQKALQDAQLSTTVASISTTANSTVTTTIQDATTTNPTVTVITQEIEPVKPSLVQSTIKSVETVDSTNIQSSKPVGLRTEQADNTSFALNLVRQNQQRENAIVQQASQGAIQAANVAAVASIRQAESLALESAKTSQTSDKQEHQTIGDPSINLVKQDQLLILSSQPSSIVNIGQQSRQQTVVETTTQQTSTSAIVVFNAMQTGAISPVQEIVLVQPPLTFQLQQTQQFTYQSPQQVITETKPQTTFQQDNLIDNNQIITLQLPQQTTEVVQSQLQAANITSVNSIELPSTNLHVLQQLPVVSVDIPQTQQTFTTDRTSPLNALLETKPSLQLEDTKEVKTASVNTKSEDNTIAGGVSISAISVVPVGFSAYTIALADANFYQPKEIYRNQRTIDNRRALQNLRSDQLHEQMINQQWR